MEIETLDPFKTSANVAAVASYGVVTGFVTLAHLPFSVRLLDHFCRFTCVHEWHFMLCNKEEFQIELSCMIVLWQMFIGHRSAWFPLLSACRHVELSCVLCIVKAHFYRKTCF